METKDIAVFSVNDIEIMIRMRTILITEQKRIMS